MSLTKLVNFHLEINKLKSVIRYSTYQESVQESTADHSWKLALLSLDVIDYLGLNLNAPHTIKLALVHDLCECGEVRDIDSILVAQGKITKRQKKQQEEEAIRNLAERFNRQDIYKLWKEYEERRTPESRYVRAMDKLESLTHLIQRGKRGRNYDDGDHIATYADDAVREFPLLEPLLSEIKLRLKKVYKKQSFPWKSEYNYALTNTQG